MRPIALLTLLFPIAALAQDDAEPAPAPAPVAVARLPVLAERLRAQDVEETELLALLETTQGAGVSLDLLVDALGVVVEELEAGVVVFDLALRLPSMITQGMTGGELAQVIRAAGESAAASAAMAPLIEVGQPAEEPSTPAPTTEESPATPNP